MLALPKKTRGSHYAVEFDVLMYLRYLATGSFMLISGELLNLSKSSCHRAVHLVAEKISHLHNDLIKFPDSLSRIKQKFLQKSRFPEIIGAIDCTQIKIQSPSRENGEIFRNRKGYFSINVQAVCDLDQRFLDVVCQWPGSTHDSRIFNNSRLRVRLDEGELQGKLLGDAGYPLLPYLITPYPQNVSRERSSNTLMYFYKYFL